ncbi:MAG: serine hydrolase [Pseudomonadota bacterium]
MKHTRVALLLLATMMAGACQPSGTAEPPSASIEARVTRIENALTPTFQISGEPVDPASIDARLEVLGIPGVSIAFVADGEIAWARAYGMADVADTREMTVNTLLLAGSISKPVAALRALQLVDSGTLDLDENVNDYLTSWQVPDNDFTATEKVTLRRLLNHTAGLTVWGFPGYDKGDAIPSVVDVLDGKGNTGPVRVYKEPGESWQYSGGGYTVMQLMISDTEAPTSFVETLDQHVLDPLGMAASTFENPLPESLWASAATGYRFNGDEVEGKWPIYPEMAAAGLWTTPSELIRYAIEVQTILANKEDGVLAYQTVQDMLDAPPGSHGLGPSLDEHTFGHGGADEGFRAQLIAWKDSPHALVVMVNSDNGSIIPEIVQAVASEYDLPGYAPTVRTPITMSSEALTPYAGTYDIGRLGTVTFSVDGEQLKITGAVLSEPMYLRPESVTAFFDVTDGELIEFESENDQVTGFRTPRTVGVRIEKD